jgi:hypothetical protein
MTHTTDFNVKMAQFTFGKLFQKIYFWDSDMTYETTTFADKMGVIF